MRYLLMLFAAMAGAQQPKTAPLKRTPPTVMAKRITPAPPKAEEPDARIELTAPKPDLLITPVDLLSKTAEEAIRISTQWRDALSAPTLGTDGSVTYQYGRGLPVLVCSPLMVCILQLQAGEKILGEPYVGDSERWMFSPAFYGTVDNPTSVIVLKPKGVGYDTSMLVTTDRRPYYVRLVSREKEYTARVAFTYPEDEKKKWAEATAAQTKQQAKVQPVVLKIEQMNFRYQVTGGKEWMRPIRVFDDGAKTYMQMHPEMANREAPALMVIGDDGKGIMSNYRMNGTTYVMDGLFDRAELRIGDKKKVQKVNIYREPKGDS